MESGSRSHPSLNHSPSKISEFIGTLIAILTLTLPVLVVARYSGTPYNQVSVPPAPSPAIIVRQPQSQTKGR